MLPTTVAVVQFQDVEHASRAAIDSLNHGVNLRMFSEFCLISLTQLTWVKECIELLDKASMAGINAYNKDMKQWPEKDSLFIKIQGPTPVMIEESAKILKAVAEKHGGTGFEFAATEKEAEQLWLARKTAMMAGFAVSPGSKALFTDVWYVLELSRPMWCLTGPSSSRMTHAACHCHVFHNLRLLHGKTSNHRV